jgi:parallel beta-helix repeat protein
MFKKFLYVLFWTSLALSLKVHSTTYYISSSGNDANDGLSESFPWQTIDKINSFTFADNDTILFKRGEVFRGAIELSKSPTGIKIRDYGTGDNPVISGSVEITGWTTSALGPNIYKADVSGLPLSADGIHHLWGDGQLMTIARYPNVDSPDKTNWLQVDATAGKTGFTDPNLATYGKPDDYWVDSTLRIRDYSWTYTVTKVTGYTASNGQITADRLSNQLPEWGYFLDDKLEELDHPGEWYYDANTQTVYFYPKGGVDPNTSLIEGSIYDAGISISNGQNNTLIENLTFRHFMQKGVHLGVSNDCIVRNNHFEHNVQGITTWNSANLSITSNTFDNQLNSAIGLNSADDFDVQNSVAEKNTVTNTALYPLYGIRYDGVYQGIGISVFGQAYTVRQNTTENSSHAGIRISGKGLHLIENNVVRNAMLLLNDGGATVISSDGNQIIGNFFLDSVGNVDESNGCAHTNSLPCPHHHTYGMGIGANNTLKDNVIEGNTVANNAHEGIRLNSFTNTTVRNNIVYNNQKNQIIVEDIYGSKISNNNVIEDNIIYPLSPEQPGLTLTNLTNHGNFDNNYYCNPYSEIVLMRDKKRYALAHWQSIFAPYEQSSRWCGITASEYSVSNVGTNLIQNSTFDADVSNWKGSGASDIFHDTTDGGRLKAVYSGTGEAKVMPKSFALTTGLYYRLTFSVVGNGFGTIQLRINNTDPNNRSILKERFFAYDQNRKNYEMFFQSPITTTFGKILFITTQDSANTYWLDDVYFEQVTVTLNDATQQSPLFMNPTAQPKTMSLGGTTYYDLDGNEVTGSITLDPFSSQILVTSEPPPPPPVSMTINLMGNGSGTVTAPTGVGSGIDCGTTCTETYAYGTPITLTATPNADSIFTGWTGTGCSENVTIITQMSCTANFALSGHTLTLNKAGTGNGTVSSTGIDCGADCTESYVNGTALSLNIIPDANSTFTGWTGTGCSENFAITSDMSCTANFALLNHTLTVNKAGSGSGTVSSTGIDCGTDCTESYVSGTAVTFTITPAADSSFGGWSGANCANSFNITADMNCTATFDLNPVSQPLPTKPSYALRVNTDGSGEIISNPTGITCGTDCIHYYISGTTITLTAIPDNGMNFKGWTGACSGSDDIVEVLVNSEKNCTAQFEPIEISSETYPLTITIKGNGIITSDPAGITCGENCSANYVADTMVTLNVNEEQAKFVDFSGDADCLDGTVTMNQPVNCVATFETLNTGTEVPNDNGENTTDNGTNIPVDSNGENTTDNGTNIPVDSNGENTTDNGTDTQLNHNENSESTAENYRLTITTLGNGIVNSEPVGITCGEDCIEDYPKDTLVTFTATLLDDNTQFIGFSGDADCLDGLVTMNQSLDCIAIFEPITIISDEVTETASDIVESDNELPIMPVTLPMNYFLTITRIGNGTVSSEPAGILCGDACSANYPSDTVVNLTVGLEANMEFQGFTGDPDCSDGVVTLTKPTHCVATFQALNPGNLQFAASEYNISEEAEQLIVTVKRLDGHDGTVIVNYATQDNSAIAGYDYVDTRGTLKWEDGDQSDRNLTIPLLDNQEKDGDKTFTLVLFGVSDQQVTVTILDNETLGTKLDEQTCPTSDLVDEVCNAQGQTLSNLRVSQAGKLGNVVLEGTVINNGWISNATIQADTTLSGGIVSGYINNQGILENFEFRGASVKGGTLRGLITNTQNGTIEDVVLAAQTEISGGQLAGNIGGDAGAPGQLNHLTVQAGSTLSHVIIGDNVQMSSDVSLGRGVRFANRQPIPTALELITVLPALPQPTCGEPGTMPELVDLRANVWQPSDSILSHINELPALLDNGWEITQHDPNGYLQLTLAEWHYAVQPMSIKYSTAPANLQVQENQSTRFLIDGGLDILTQPAVQAPCDLVAALEEMGLSNLIGQTNGNLKIPAFNNSWYSARPDFASVTLTTDTATGLYLLESPIISHGIVAALVFIEEEGLRRQQTFYPALAVPEALYASAQEVVIESNGLVNFKLDEQSYRGVVDYLVTPSSLPGPKQLQIIRLSDINQDGTEDFALHYPTGEQQIVFALP